MLLLCACGAWAVTYNLQNSELLFEEFVKKYNKTYSSLEERQAKFENFKAHLEIINRKNNGSSHAVYDINAYSDLNKNELLRRTTGFRVSLKKNLGARTNYQCGYQPIDHEPGVILPESFDWRSRNVVTSVKNQRECGSCWAYSTIANIESLYAIKHGLLYDLSEQHLVNCDPLNNGCNGGLMHWALESILHEGGVVLETDDPYVGVDSVCKARRHAFPIEGCIRYDLRNENRLRELLVANGPVSLAIDVIDLTDYREGIAEDCGYENGLNHAVLLVGYGIQNGIPYWLLKNSWGTSWGEGGYFRVRRNMNACGMMNEYASTAIL